MANFKDEFDGTTDLIYGIGDQINRYIVYKLHGKKYDKIFGANRAEAIEYKEECGWAINTFNVHLNNIDYMKNQSGLFGEYCKALAASTYKPGYKSVPYNPSGPTLEKLKKSNAALLPKAKREVLNAAFDLSVRRSCKFGIEFVTQKLAGKIHYVLDGMNLEAVTTKARITNTSGYQKIPICTSELRFLFRNWNKFRGRGKVIFWENFDHALPPWNRPTYAANWKAYGLSRLEKYWTKIATAGGLDGFLTREGAKNPKDFTQAKIVFDKMTAADFVKTFHDIPVNFSNKESIEIV